MQNHYDLTKDDEGYDGVISFRDEGGREVAIIKSTPEVAEVANSTITFRLGLLTPTAAKELWDCLVECESKEAEMAAVAIGQYFFDIYGKDIADGWDTLFR